MHHATLRRRAGDAPHGERANARSPLDGGVVVDGDAGGDDGAGPDDAPLDVVVKMQHEGVAELFACDLASAQRVAKIVCFFEVLQ